MNDDIPSFSHFDHDDAWKLGCIIVDLCEYRRKNLPAPD